MLRDVAGPELVRRFREELAPYLAAAPFGRNDFEGFRSQRLYALLAKAPAAAELVAHPAVLELVDAVLDAPCLLSANIAINVHPGETAQSLHPDDGYCDVPRPRRPSGCRRSGRSRTSPPRTARPRWSPAATCSAVNRSPTDPRIRAIEMSAGSVVVFLGTRCIAAERTAARRPARAHAAVLPAVDAADREYGARRAARRRRHGARAGAGAARLQHPAAVHRLRRRAAPAADPRARRWAPSRAAGTAVVVASLTRSSSAVGHHAVPPLAPAAPETEV